MGWVDSWGEESQDWGWGGSPSHREGGWGKEGRGGDREDEFPDEEEEEKGERGWGDIENKMAALLRDMVPRRHDVGSSPGFEKVQRFLRQQRATGRVVSPEESRSAWKGYWEAWSGKKTERERIGLEQERLALAEKSLEWQKEHGKEQLDIQRQQIRGAESAAGIGGIADIFGTIIIGSIFGGWF